MNYRRLPRTELNVSTLCLGTMTFGRPLAKPDAIQLVHAALDLGINFFDTADMYEGYDRQAGSAGGVAESILGQALKGQRQKAILITKVGNSIGGTSYSGSGLSAGHIRHQIEASLRRLATEYVDLYLLHRPDPNTPLAETLATMAGLIREGKILHWGFSNFDVAQIREMLKICETESWPLPVVSQPRYNWLRREVELEHLPLCQQYQIGVTPYQPLAGGLLTGKYRPGMARPEDSRATDGSGWLAMPDESVLARLDGFLGEAEVAGYRPVTYALEWLLRQPAITAPIVGIKRLDQLTDLII